MTSIDISRIDHEKLSQEVRIRLAARLERLLNAMEILIDGDPRDLSASQGSIYLQAVKLLGDLYQVRERPQSGDMVPADKVQKLVDAAVTQAVEAARIEERELLRTQRLMELEAAGTSARARLQLLRDRATG